MRHHFNHTLDHVRKSDGFRLEVLATREREHVLRQSGAARSRLHRSSKPSRQASVVRDPTARHVEVGHHDHEQIVEIVRDPARQLSKALELLHLCDLRQCRFTLPRPGLDPLLQLRIRRRKLSRTSFDSPLRGGRPQEVVNQSVDGALHLAPSSGADPETKALARSSLPPDDLPHLFKLLGHPLARRHDVIERIGYLAGETDLISRQPRREIACPRGLKSLQESA